MSENVDLNQSKIVNDFSNEGTSLVDNSIKNIDANVSIIFRKHKDILLEKIRQYNCILGCVAWLTDFEIIRAFSKVKRVCIIVQKEDFLRPDLNAGTNWRNDLRIAYNELPIFIRYDFSDLISGLSYCSGENAAIRCVGNYNRDKKPAFPRMHNKFLVFSNYIEGSQVREDDGTYIKPIINHQEVWTGSYNLTKNAENSLENVVLIKNSKIAEAYYSEFYQILALSEPLDWETDWSAPEFKIGS